MAAKTIHTTTSNTGRDLIGALRQAKAMGLSETVIGNITNTGTIAKLRTALTTLKTAAHEADKNHWTHIIDLVNQAEDLGIITDADVDAGRDASSGSRFTALVTPIAARLDGISTSAPSDWQIK